MFAILLYFLLYSKTTGHPTDIVTIPKCCGFDQTLDFESMECVNSSNINWTKDFATLKDYGYPSNWAFKENTFPPCDRFEPIFYRQLLLTIQNGFFLLSLGKEITKNFCVDAGIILLCPGEYSLLFGKKTIINRCCGEASIYSKQEKHCVTSSQTPKDITIGRSEMLFNDLIPCDDFEIREEFTGEIGTNGTLFMDGYEIPARGYCLEYLNETDEVPSVLACTQYIVQSVQPKPADFRFILYPIALSLSVIFLAATLIASFLMPASHHVLHWRCQTNYVLCLLLGDVVLCIVQFSGSSLADLEALCTILAFSMHFLFLSAFFWLNTMCFNIWWTFRDLRPQNLEKSQERCRLRLYVVYACGFPAVIALIGLILDLVGDNTAFYQPGFGKHKCWFQGNMEIMLYFFIPVGILLAVNLALFVATARELTCGLWKRELVKSTTERAALGRVCLKLVIVMGVFWIADIISWVAGGPHEYWYSTDIFNCLQGVFIFIVVGCQPQVLAAVKRYWCWRRGSTVETAGTTNHHSSTSQGQPSMGDTMCNHSVSNNTKSIALETSC